MTTTLYSTLIRPKYDVEDEIKAAIASGHSMNSKDVDNLVSLSEQSADLSAKLIVANSTTMCENGKTVLENLELYRSLKYITNRASVINMPPASLVMLHNRIENLMALIREANNKEI